MHIVFLPCILVSGDAVCMKKTPDVFQGYYTIASKLLKDPKTIRSMYSPLLQFVYIDPSRRDVLPFVDSGDV